ncbi:MAG: glutamate--cysteine ligase [Gammaproteobacteria bacterium]
MGQEIDRIEFSQGDHARFRARLERETRLAADAFARGEFADAGFVGGFELEAWLTDRNLFPAARNAEVLARLGDPLVVPELSRFNIELNGLPQALGAGALARMERELQARWARSMQAAHDEEATLVAIGILPTVREADLSLANISDLKRYAALNRQVLAARGGRPIALAIGGIESLALTHADVMLEAATTSFQVHLQTPAAALPRYYNASALLAAPLVAVAANSPFLFGRALWHETRIPLFEQAVDCGDGIHCTRGRVTFGEDWLPADPTAVFRDNLRDYEPLLPLCAETPAGRFAHLRLHNGTIWRWIRVLPGFDDAGRPHLRIEQRVMPAGPSVIDMIANAALYFGATHWLATRPQPPEEQVAFVTARENFYESARAGMNARIAWIDGRSYPAPDLLREELVPRAGEGLRALGLGEDEIDRYLGVIRGRLRCSQNGALWQLAHADRHSRDLFRLTADYLECQRSGMPVHEWPV